MTRISGLPRAGHRASDPLPPQDVQDARINPETMERELIFAMAKSYRFYREARDIICLRDALTQTFRRDFTVPRYNELFDIIDHFWRAFDNRPPTVDRTFPPAQLAAYIIDRGNKNWIAYDVAEQLSQEVINDCQFMAELDIEYCFSLLQSNRFKDWLRRSIMDHAVAKITNLRALGRFTPKTIEDLLNEVRRSDPDMIDVYVAKPLGDFKRREAGSDDEIIGPRGFLCRGAIAQLVAATGLGKSTFVMQLAMLFAIGRNCFGFDPYRQRKVLYVQAENDEHEIAEIRDGVLKGLAFGHDDTKVAHDNVLSFKVNDRVGTDFVAHVIEPLLITHKPDLLILDPVLAYVGGNVSEQEAVGTFLRTKLIPVLERLSCACLLVHHANKPNRGNERAVRPTSDLAYMGSGSIEFANIARAVITLIPTKDPEVFALTVPKRGKRLGWVDATGKPTIRKFIRHSPDINTICWLEATAEDVARRSPLNEAEVINRVFGLIPGTTAVTQKRLFDTAQIAGIGNSKVRRAVKILCDRGSLKLVKNKRHRGPAEILFIRADGTTQSTG